MSKYKRSKLGTVGIFAAGALTMKLIGSAFGPTVAETQSDLIATLSQKPSAHTDLISSSIQTYTELENRAYEGESLREGSPGLNEVGARRICTTPEGLDIRVTLGNDENAEAHRYVKEGEAYGIESLTPEPSMGWKIKTSLGEKAEALKDKASSALDSIGTAGRNLKQNVSEKGSNLYEIAKGWIE